MDRIGQFDNDGFVEFIVGIAVYCYFKGVAGIPGFDGHCTRSQRIVVENECGTGTGIRVVHGHIPLSGETLRHCKGQRGGAAVAFGNTCRGNGQRRSGIVVGNGADTDWRGHVSVAYRSRRAQSNPDGFIVLVDGVAVHSYSKGFGGLVGGEIQRTAGNCGVVRSGSCCAVSGIGVIHSHSVGACRSQRNGVLQRGGAGVPFDHRRGVDGQGGSFVINDGAGASRGA